jgi:hypothetical protein
VEVVPFLVTYNGMATGPAIKLCVEFLLGKQPRSFGPAIERVDLCPHCQTREPVIAGLDSMRDRFQARLASLPFVRFRRKLQLFEVAYASQLVHSEAMFGSSKAKLSPADFGCLCREFAAALTLIRRRLKRTDAFDAAGLEAHLQRRLDSLPEGAAPG